MNKSIRNINYVIIICLTFILISCQGTKNEASQGPGGNPPPRVISVDGYIIFPNHLERAIQSTGTILPYESLDIRAERSGKLVMLNAPESSYVKAGHLLGKIDDSELIAQKEKLLVSLDYANSELERGEALVAIQGITTEEVDRLENQIKSIQSDIKILDVQIEKSKILAPFSGVLGLRRISQGAYITPADIIIDLQQTHKVRLDFDVPERYLNTVKANQKVSFGIAGSNETYDARVYAFSNEISPATRTFKVRAIADNGHGKLKPGQFSKVNLVTGFTDEAMMIPTDAIVPVLDGKQVFVYKSGRVSVHLVETNLRKEGLVEVTSGVSMGDTIIMSALLSIIDGAPVEIANIINTDKISD